MTVYARSDLALIAIPADGGGCGDLHSRPVINGAPAKVWALVCPQCELQLGNDPLWATHPDLIPKTADEERRAARLAEEGTSTMNKVAEALAINAAKILNENQQAETRKATEMAEHAAAAKAEQAAAAAERANAEYAARLKQAQRVAESLSIQVPADVPAVPPLVKHDSVDVEIHDSRKCKRCGLSLTRKAHSAGRWPNECLTCRRT